MTDQQTIAIENPCELAEQCANQRYRTMTQSGRHIISVLLTVNVGDE